MRNLPMLRPFETNERWLITGATGSGKSVAASWIAANTPDDLTLVAIDSKGDGMPAFKAHSVASARRLLRSWFRKKPRVIRITPEPYESAEEFDALFSEILNRRYTGLWIDEAYMVPDTPYFRHLYTAGRSADCPVITCSQRPVDIPRVCISEASRFMIFKLLDVKDRERLAGFTPFNKHQTVDRFHFLYYDSVEMVTGEYAPIPFKDYQEGLKGYVR